MFTGQQIQDMLAGMSKRIQEERAGVQMTLGKLIKALEAMPAGAQVSNINGAHSYRGYYDDLAFERGEGTQPASELLAKCRDAMGRVFDGYKGGDFVMHENTPVWIAEYGNCGQMLMGFHPDGTIIAKDDE